jgi:NAD(P)-dependent dehydrogenase (short-subunit alcohol dehydrogenase family)
MQKDKQAALVTGSAIRLGKHIALNLARAGYDIALHYNSSADAALATKAEIEALGVVCEAFQFNLKDAAGSADFIGKVKAHFPHLSVLVNSASGYTAAPIAETSPEIFDDQFALNIRAPFFLSQAFAAQVATGNIVNIIDNKLAYHQYAYAAYLLAKKSLADFTRMAALEFAPRIRVNAVAPGVVLPASVRSEEYIQWRIQGIPLQKQGNPDHIGQAVLNFLQNDFLTGQIMVVDGGENISNVGQHSENWKKED